MGDWLQLRVGATFFFLRDYFSKEIIFSSLLGDKMKACLMTLLVLAFFTAQASSFNLKPSFPSFNKHLTHAAADDEDIDHYNSDYEDRDYDYGDEQKKEEEGAGGGEEEEAVKEEEGAGGEEKTVEKEIEEEKEKEKEKEKEEEEEKEKEEAVEKEIEEEKEGTGNGEEEESLAEEVKNEEGAGDSDDNSEDNDDDDDDDDDGSASCGDYLKPCSNEAECCELSTVPFKFPIACLISHDYKTTKCMAIDGEWNRMGEYINSA